MTLSPPFTVMVPTALMALAEDVLRYLAPVVLTVSTGPSVSLLPMTMVPSLLMPLPPAPVILMLTVPPCRLMLPSEVKPLAVE